MRRIRAGLLSVWCYEESCLRFFAKFLLGVLGFIFCGAVVALAFGGVFVLLIYENYIYLFQESFFPLPGWLAVAAALILLPTGVLAISISAKNSCYQQGALTYLLLVLLCLETSLAVLTQFYYIWMASELKRTMGYLIYQYNRTDSQGSDIRTVDEVQRKLQCCGVHNYTDWLKATDASWHLSAEKAHVPQSCCKEKYSYCRGDLGHLEQIFQEGCLKKLEDQLHFVILYLFWCCIALIILELLAGVSISILMRPQPFHRLRILDSCNLWICRR